MKSVGEITSEIWPDVKFLHFFENFDLDLWPWTSVKVIGTWVIICAILGCTLVPCIKSVGEIASEIWPIFSFFSPILRKFELDLFSLTYRQSHSYSCHKCALLGSTFVPTVKSVGDIEQSGNQLMKVSHWPSNMVNGTWVNKCALLGCTLVPSIKSVGDISSEIWQVEFFTHLWENLTFTYDLDLWPWPFRSRSSALG